MIPSFLEWFLAGVMIASYIFYDMENGTIAENHGPPQDEDTFNGLLFISAFTILFTELVLGIWLSANFYFYMKRRLNRPIEEKELKVLPKKKLKK